MKKPFIQSRLQALRREMKHSQINAMLVSDPYNVRYLSDFVGLAPNEKEAYLLILEKTQILLVNSLYFAEAKNKFPEFLVYELDPKHSLSHYLEKYTNSSKLALELDSFSALEWNEIRHKLPKLQFVSALPIIKILRQVKDAVETKHIRKAVAITDQTWSFILTQRLVGKTELEIAMLLEWFIRQHGAEDIAWRPIIVATGKNSAHPHHVTSTQKVNKGDLVLIDLGAKYKGYVSDMTRIIFTDAPNAYQKKVYETVLRANSEAERNISEQIETQKLDQIARKIMTDQGFNENRQYPHNLGHGIGLEIHEKPSIGPYTIGKLQEQMIFTIEPAIYIPGEFGVRIEDTVMIRNHKAAVLTKSSKELTVIR